MTRVEAALRRIVADLALGAHGFALVGGFAISARTEPRFTRDIDLVMAVADDEEAEQVLRALRANATGDDLALARTTAELITARGYARGRDLTAALDALAAGS